MEFETGTSSSYLKIFYILILFLTKFIVFESENAAVL